MLTQYLHQIDQEHKTTKDLQEVMVQLLIDEQCHAPHLSHQKHIVYALVLHSSLSTATKHTLV